MFPKELDGAKVLLYKPKGAYGGIKYPNGAAAETYSYLAICKYPEEDAYYLFCCNDSFEVVSDWQTGSIEACIHIATSSYRGKIHWNQDME